MQKGGEGGEETGQKAFKDDVADTSEILVDLRSIPDRIMSHVRKQLFHNHTHEEHTIRLAD